MTAISEEQSQRRRVRRKKSCPYEWERTVEKVCSIGPSYY